MNLRVPIQTLAVVLLSTAAFGQAIPGSPADAFQVRYASNLLATGSGSSIINITNAGTTNTAGGALTNLCINVYAFSPDEQLVSCCTCTVTPNGLVSLDVKRDLTTNTLTPGIVPSAVIKLVATSGSTCNASSVAAANLAAGMVAWGTTFHALPQGGFGITETRFSNEGLSTAELARITSFCGFIQGNGSGFGICSSCKPGGQGAIHQ
jgi:hypothetical protein